MAVIMVSSGTSPPGPVHRFSVAEYRRLAEAGVLTEEDRVELLEGWLIPKMTHNPPHDAVIQRLNKLLNKLLPDSWDVRVQSSISTSDSEPEPDLAVVRGPAEKYFERHPSGPDIGLVVEVADTSLAQDRWRLGMYARAGIPEYWIINLKKRMIEVSQDPLEKVGEYRLTRHFQAGESLKLQLPDGVELQFSVDELLPETGD